MCQLLGLNFNHPVRASLSFRGFMHRGNTNPHGWGIARYEGKACQIFKEPVKAMESNLAEFVRDYDQFSSNIFIGHVRLASHGEHTLQNTHPFVRTFRSREVVLAHNGTLRTASSSTGLLFHPVGETDSEYLLCALLTALWQKRIRFTDYQRIEEVLLGFNAMGTMNLLFSEGQHLYSYRDINGYNGLCITVRQPPFSSVHLRDEDWEAYLPAQKNMGQRGVVIATRPLSDETWHDLNPGCLSVFKDGQCVYGRR